MEMKVQNFNDEELNQKLVNMFTDIGFEGIFSVEFLIDKDGKLWFLEINFRDSTWSWASTKLGMNLLVLWADGMLHDKFPADARKTIPENYIALAEAEDFSHRVLRLKLISVFQWVRGILKADCLYDWDFKDPVPVFSYWFTRGCHFIDKKLRGKKNANH